jgi:hypothetical protein
MMGDALVCVKCGLDKYPEAIPDFVRKAAEQNRIIEPTDPNYDWWCEKARAAVQRSDNRKFL